MDSPVQIPFKSFIQLNPQDDTAIYLQLIFGFIKAIQTGLLPEGTKLPGSRVLCRLLGINRNTLIKSFADLEAQGFIKTLPNKGTFILSDHKRKSSPVIPDKTNEGSPFKFKRSAILDNPVEISDLLYQFNDGLPDMRLIHTDVMGRLYLSKLKRQKRPAGWEYIQRQSNLNFKRQFSNFLNITRGIRIGIGQLLTTASHESSLYLATKALITASDNVVVASPGYYLPHMTLADSGAHLISIPVDEHGISTEHLKQACTAQQVRLLYITSNYHYPTTVPLGAKRRMEILELANQYGFIILEDDYDFEFHYDNNPILPLASFDPGQRVVYVGSFGKSLPSGFGHGFITGPAEFISELQKHQNILEPGVDLVKEQVLTEWIQDGEVHRLSKKNKLIYRERRDYFVMLLARELNGKIRFHIPARGLAVWVEWLDKFSLVKLQKECAAHNLFLPKTILYQTKNMRATRLGFGHLDHSEMEIVVGILKNALAVVTNLLIGNDGKTP